MPATEVTLDRADRGRLLVFVEMLRVPYPLAALVSKRRLAAIAAACSVLGCSGTPTRKPVRRSGPAAEVTVSIPSLKRELESSVLETLGQLTLGNIETYADGLRPDEPVTLLGVTNDGTFVGSGRESVGIDRWPLSAHRPQFLSKNLSLSISKAGDVGWTFDEISVRVEVDGRWASLPVRVSTVFVRDVDRWVMAMDHWSYPMAIHQIVDGGGVAKSAAALTGRRKSPDADVLLALVGRLENGDTRAKEQRLTTTERAVLSHPEPGVEYRGAKISSAPLLTELFEGAQTVGIRDYRVESSISGTVAWMAANLVLSGKGDRALEIVLRASYVFEHTDQGWKVVQAHISAPLSEQYLEKTLYSESVQSQAAGSHSASRASAGMN